MFSVEDQGDIVKHRVNASWPSFVPSGRSFCRYDGWGDFPFCTYDIAGDFCFQGLGRKEIHYLGVNGTSAAFCPAAVGDEVWYLF